MTTPVISRNGTIYIGNSNDTLYAMNRDGTVKWTYQTGENIYSIISLHV